MTTPAIIIATQYATGDLNDFATNSNSANMHYEDVLSGLVLIALLAYFYTAFGKVFQASVWDNDKQRLGSRIYYSSPAAV